MSPTIRIDGYPAHSGYGIIDIPVVPGHHIISGEYHWLWTYGQAQLNMQVGPGKVVPVFYNGPWINFSKGSIGHEPQQAPGTGCLIATLVVMGVLVLIAVLLAIFGGTT
ncbi:MAG: hypothetical protein Q4D79_03730 [Propionibacteriaceae bacterium]|nr:hypothetical protein [Propionibacteriaceae bacterium]